MRTVPATSIPSLAHEAVNVAQELIENIEGAYLFGSAVESGLRVDEIIFFDRAIPDALAYAHLENLPISKDLQFYAEKYRYNPKVFIFPP